VNALLGANLGTSSPLHPVRAVIPESIPPESSTFEIAAGDWPGLMLPAIMTRRSRKTGRSTDVIERVWTFAVILLCGPAVGYSAAYFLLWLRSY
jgi:hypothetical protein